MSLPFTLVLLSQHLLPCPPCLQVVDDIESDDGRRYGLEAVVQGMWCIVCVVRGWGIYMYLSYSVLLGLIFLCCFFLMCSLRVMRSLNTPSQYRHSRLGERGEGRGERGERECV